MTQTQPSDISAERQGDLFDDFPPAVDTRFITARRIDLDDRELTIDQPPDANELLALDEALTQFAQKHPGKAELVKLRYFAGLTTEQAADALGISVRTAGRDWAYARAWLYDRITSS